MRFLATGARSSMHEQYWQARNIAAFLNMQLVQLVNPEPVCRIRPNGGEKFVQGGLVARQHGIDRQQHGDDDQYHDIPFNPQHAPVLHEI